jgi:hypothetical protein
LPPSNVATHIRIGGAIPSRRAGLGGPRVEAETRERMLIVTPSTPAAQSSATRHSGNRRVPQNADCPALRRFAEWIGAHPVIARGARLIFT